MLLAIVGPRVFQYFSPAPLQPVLAVMEACWPVAPKLEALPVERTAFGFTQRARFCHPDLHDEEVLEIDSPFAPLVASGTRVLSFVVLGDQNAGKSTFLHAFSYTDEPAWLSLSSFLPILSSAFLNVRLLAADDDTPPRDELPYLDTDIGRSNFLMTAENFAFFMQEMGLGEAPELRDCLAHDSRFVLTQFIEIGGDHLDRLLARQAREPATPTNTAPQQRAQAGQGHPAWLEDTLNMTERLLSDVGRGAYMINAETLFERRSAADGGQGPPRLVLATGALRQLLARLTYLSRQASSSGLTLMLLLSRLYDPRQADAPKLDTAESIREINAALPQLSLVEALPYGLSAEDFAYRPADLDDQLPAIDDDVELDLRVEDHPLAFFVRTLLAALRHPLRWSFQLAQVIPATQFELASTAASPTRAVQLSVPGVLGLLVRLFSSGMVHRSSAHPDSLVASHILQCFTDSSSRLNATRGSSAEEVFDFFVSAQNFRAYLEEAEDSAEVPVTTILQRFEPVARQLIGGGFCLEHAARSHAALSVRFSVAGSGAEAAVAPLGEWLVWCGGGGGGGGGATPPFGVRFPYTPSLLAAMRGIFDREVPTELWLHAEQAPSGSSPPVAAALFAGMQSELAEAQAALEAAIRRVFRQLCECGDLAAGAGPRLVDAFAWRLEELALLAQLHGRACARLTLALDPEAGDADAGHRTAAALCAASSRAQADRPAALEVGVLLRPA